MKKIKNCTLTIILTILTISLFAQPSMYKDGDWQAGETKLISGTNIKKIEGENSSSSITNIGYQTQHQIFAYLKESKKNGTIGGDKYKMEVEKYQKYCAGGYVQLYITRETQEACNPKWFHVDVKDKNGAVIFQKDLKDEAAIKFKDEPGFKCQSLAFIKAEAFLPITVELTEIYNDKISKYIYEVISVE